ncbi:MAG: serine/threonine-protein kinase [Phycisphaerales bacterium]
MTDEPSLFRRVETLFERVVDLPEPKRTRALNESGDPRGGARFGACSRRTRHDRRTPRAPRADAAAERDRRATEPRHFIARYRVVQDRVGRHGRGVRSRAGEPARRVALKLVRSGLLNEDLLRRFAFRSEVLQALPGIAQVSKAGTSETGEPFFAMEFVEGEPLTDRARAWLDRRSRLELFTQVCDAVHHAHQKGVVHRDLKPSNILVTPNGRTKVLDFGVARLAETDVRAETVHTEAGQLIGTLGYMSPEQTSGDPTRIDTRADVYALGVLLYELLAGKLPIEVGGASLFEALTRVREQEPTRLGTLDTRMRGDLETIVGKALEKDPERRYQSAAELGEDVRRFLTDQPINARPPTTRYHLAKFARRNKALVTAASVVAISAAVALVAISVGLKVAVEQRRRAEAATALAEKETQRAEEQAEITAAVNNFMHIDLLGAIAPGHGGRDVTVREAVDAAAEHADESFTDRPEIAGAVHASIGNIYNAIGEYDASERELKHGVEMLDASVGPLNEISIYARQDLGDLYLTLGRLDEAGPLLEAARANADEAFGPEDPRTLAAGLKLAALARNQGRYADAGESLERVLALARPDDAATREKGEGELASLYMEQRRYAEALPIYQRIAERQHRDRPDNDTLTLTADHNVATVLEGLGRYDEALAIYKRVLAGEEQVYGVGHPDTLVTKHNLAFLMESMGRYDEAEPLYRETLDACRQVFGPGHFGTLTCTRSLCSLLMKTGRAQDAVDLLEPAITTAKGSLGADHPLTAELEMSEGKALLALDRPAEAAAALANAAGIIEGAYGPGAAETLEAKAGAALAYIKAGDASGSHCAGRPRGCRRDARRGPRRGRPARAHARGLAAGR